MIKLILKIFISAILIFILSLIGFYIYGSSPNHQPEQLQSVLTYESHEVPTKDTLSILTYNIGYCSGMTNNLPESRHQDFFENNLHQAGELIRRIQPDFIGLQEIDFSSNRSFNHNQLDSLALKGDFLMSAYAINWDKKYVPFPYWPPSTHFGKIVSGQAILSKYPITDHQRIQLEKPLEAPFYYQQFYIDRLIEISKIKLGAGELVIMNVHLEAFDQKTREEQAKVVVDYYNSFAAENPVLLVGDFNAVPNKNASDKTINIIMQGNHIEMAITTDQYSLNEKAYYTYNSEKPDCKLDYIFYSKDKITPVDSRVLTEAGLISDHLPVYFKFVIGNQEET